MQWGSRSTLDDQLNDSDSDLSTAKETPKADIDIYFTEGFSARFLKELTNFGNWLYHRYAKKIVDQEEYVDKFCFESCERLLKGQYNKSFGPLVTFVHTLGRNIASGYISKERRIVGDDEVLNDVQIEKPISFELEEQVNDFIRLASSRCIKIDKVALLHDIAYELSSPLLECFYWFHNKKRVTSAGFR